MTNIDNPAESSVFRFRGDPTRAQFAAVHAALLPKWLGPCIVIPCIFYLFAFMDRSWSDIVAYPERSIPDLLTAAICALMYMALTWYGRKSAWRNSIKMNGTIHGKLDDIGIEWNTDHTTTRFKWAELTKMKVLPGMMLVYYTPRCAFYFPREFFSSEEQWTGFGKLVASKFATNA